MTRVAYFQPSQRADFQDTLENAKAAAPFVDTFVVIADDSEFHRFSHEQIQMLLAVGTNVIVRLFDWEENLPKMYQHGVELAIGAKADWILFSDADEHFCEAFFRDLKTKIIPGLEQGGFNMAGVKCHAQFAIADAVWPSSLSVETTAGVMDIDKVPEKVVVTNDHKYMLMKLYPDLKWEGVGRTKTVHTTWSSPTNPWKAVFLPDEYWYLHRKTPLQVYSSAARNMWMSGGGANLGDVNKMWVELKEIMTRKGIKTWPELENFVSGEPDPNKQYAYGDDLKDWIKRALTWRATDYGIETRQTALWMIFWYKDLLSIPDIAAGVSHPPQVDDDVRAERVVQSVYVEVLGRWPDSQGLESYKQLVLSRGLDAKGLAEVLKSSDEYRERRALVDSQKKEDFRLEVPVKVDYQVTPEVLTKVFEQTKIYREVLKPRMDFGAFIEQETGPDFFKEFYDMKAKGELSLEKIIARLMEASIRK